MTYLCSKMYQYIYHQITSSLFYLFLLLAEAYLALNTFLLDYIYIIVFTRTLGNALSMTLDLSLPTYCTMLIN